MAHPPKIKAEALVMLLTGDSPRYVAEQTGVSLTTVKRWRAEAFAAVRAVIGDPLADLRRMLR